MELSSQAPENTSSILQNKNKWNEANHADYQLFQRGRHECTGVTWKYQNIKKLRILKYISLSDIKESI